jgi:hypothetical protein
MKIKIKYFFLYSLISLTENTYLINNMIDLRKLWEHMNDIDNGEIKASDSNRHKINK